VIRARDQVNYKPARHRIPELNAPPGLGVSGKTVTMPRWTALLPDNVEYRRKAEFFLRMAAAARDPIAVEGLRALAADYFELVQGAAPAAHQQQQIHPKEPEKGDK